MYLKSNIRCFDDKKSYVPRNFRPFLVSYGSMIFISVYFIYYYK